MFTTVLFVILYLAGIPFTFGLFGEKFGKCEWIVASGTSLMSWVGALLFCLVTFGIFAGCRLYEAGKWISAKIDLCTL